MVTMTGTEHGGPSGLLRFRSDWGAYNLTRVCGWLAQFVYDNTPDRRRSQIHTGRGMGDNLRALVDGEVDIAVATPGSFAALAHRGVGPFADGAMPQLRGLALLPHRDAMIAVARADLGFTSLADVATHDGPLRISLGVDDPDGFMGFAGNAMLAAAGVDLAAVVAAGGSVQRYEGPFAAIEDLHAGRADLMISEAIMNLHWERLAAETEVTFLSLTPPEQQWLRETYDLGVRTIEGGYFPGVPAPLVVMDYADWLVATTVSLPDDAAALVARAVVEDSETLARQYRHLPSERSPLTYPIDYQQARRTPVPLHPGAAEVYRLADERAQEKAVGVLR